MRWPQSRIAPLEAALSRQPPASLAHTLTLAQLASAQQRDDECRRLLADAAAQYTAGPRRDHNQGIRLLTMLLVIGDLPGASAQLEAMYGLRADFGYIPEPDEVARKNTVLWRIAGATECAFLFKAALFQTDEVDVLARFAAWLELFVTYLRSDQRQTGAVYLDLGDVGSVPGVVGCDYREDSFAVPDALFCQSRGHQAKRQLFTDRWVPWEQRLPKVFWRGTATGVMTAGWRSLPRIKLCERARDSSRADLFDVAVARYTRHMNDKTRQEIQASGLLRPPVPMEEFGKYKYQVEIPGNGHSVSWQGLTHKLCTGSPVLKIPSPLGHIQWYFDRLRPWYNFVPVAVDMSDLEEKAVWLERHDDQARIIGMRGRELMDSLDFQKELEMATGTISAAIAQHSYQFGDTQACAGLEP